jgi:hypothetical protein
MKWTVVCYFNVEKFGVQFLPFSPPYFLLEFDPVAAVGIIVVVIMVVVRMTLLLFLSLQ